MLVDVDVPSAVAERLNTASINRRWYPFAKDVIDWSIPLTDEWAYMPAGHSIFAASGVLNRLKPADRSFVERWERTQNMRNVGHGEHLLNQGILAMLWNIDPYNPAYRYLLHEVAEECQHMAMFNQWIRINKDIKTHDAGEELWSKAVSDFTQDISTRLPEAFWVNVLLFEFVGDAFNQAERTVTTGDDGRPLHPIVVQIGIAHTSEEARHISFARKWLEKGMASLDDEQIGEVQRLAEFGVQTLVDRQSFLPIHYSSQLEPYVTKEEFDANKSTSPATLTMLRQLKKLLDEFESLNVVSAEAMRRWEDTGSFD
ncbi:MAG: diiron oxygenase [Actinobacteria bacterium]|nr:diiron oxygenase [Actinomycetota bacterium]MCL6104476.1 diiron oxygenase [Actinomycetota bacterium]